MNDSTTTVHVVRFSPCGKMIASASERQVMIYEVPSASHWMEMTEDSTTTKNRLLASMIEIYDLAWSPDSKFIVIGSLEGKVFQYFIATLRK
jgi:chromatin assembly factor 1 subunit B